MIKAIASLIKFAFALVVAGVIFAVIVGATKSAKHHDDQQRVARDEGRISAITVKRRRARADVHRERDPR